MTKAPGQFVYPPHNWLDTEAWDHYWQQIITRRELIRFYVQPFISFSLKALPFLQQRNASRVLFAGNGISLEPHAWVHAGFDTTALDISPTASRFVATQNQEYPAHKYRPGGRLTVLTEDLFAHTPPERYDALFSIRSFQGFPRNEQVRLAAQFYKWLKPGGFCLVETMNVGGEHRTALESAFMDAGFFEQGHTLRKIHQRLRSSLPERREIPEIELQTAIRQDKAEENDRLNRGEKMVRFVYGSG